MKQTKMVKIVLTFLLLIPVVLFTTGLIQTFVLKAKKNELNTATTELNKAQEEYDKQSEIYEYMSSNKYLEDFYKHNNYNEESYGKDGDVNIELK